MTVNVPPTGRLDPTTPTSRVRMAVGEQAAGVLGAFVFGLASRLFALVDVTDEEDGPIVAWGLQFDDHVRVESCDGALRGEFSSVDRVLWLFSYQAAMVRLVWCAQTDETDPACHDEDALTEPASDPNM
ncbi:hypothetical protein [Frankia tisae]|uniref:hypothetical protein n=1 Tax=Frankia tisae TaxID=2950104 RepID=UPI0021C12DA3|nr:hypothetical protein [Frankia tisae]